jgi:hypothetical protein
MHNWVEFEYHCRERIADTLRWADNERRVQAVRQAAQARRSEAARRARLGRERRPAMLVLARGELLSVKVGRGGLALTCVTGRTWATSNRLSADVILLPGQSAAFTDRGTVVIEALRTATIRIECQRQPQAIFSLWTNALARPRITLFP